MLTMKEIKFLISALSIVLIGLYKSPAKALTSKYNKVSQIMIFEGVNLNQDLTITEADISEALINEANDADGLDNLRLRFFFSPSVETQILKQIQANQDNDDSSPSLEILKNQDLGGYRTKVKFARVKSNEKSSGRLDYIKPENEISIAGKTEYIFDLHDISEVNSNESLLFELDISTAKTFSGNIELNLNLTSIPISPGGGSSIDNGNSNGGSSTAANPAIEAAVDSTTAKIAEKLTDSYEVLDIKLNCGSAGSSELDACDPVALADFRSKLQTVKNDLRSLNDDKISLKQNINTARKDKLLTKKEAKKLKAVLNKNNKKIAAAKKEVNSIIKKLNKKITKGTGFSKTSARNKLQRQLDTAKTKLSKAYSELQNNVLRPLLDKNIIGQEVFDKYKGSINEANNDSSNSGSTNNNDGTTNSDETESTKQSLSESFEKTLIDYAGSISGTFVGLDKTYICRAETNENSIDICNIDSLIAYQVVLIEADAELKTANLMTNNLRRSIKTARQSRLISKRDLKRFRINLKRNSMRIKRARQNIRFLDKKLRTRVARGKTFDGIKANNFFMDRIDTAQLRLTRAYAKLQEKLVIPLRDRDLISDELKNQFEVSISEF